MILVRLMGGLGNQMFQYAFARSMALKNKVELKLDASLLGPQESAGSNHVVRHYDLDIFAPGAAFASKKEVELFNGKAVPSVAGRIAFRLNRIAGRHRLIIQKENEYDPLQLASVTDDCCLVGRWQSELFFREHAAEVRKMFSFKGFVPGAASKQISEEMERTVSVGIHVRRGDYVSNPLYASGIGALVPKYYTDAIAAIAEKLGSEENAMTLFFISDDMDWCRKTFGHFPRSVFAEQVKGKDGYAADLWLLTRCRHVVISNSTFAWWGAYLGESEQGIVVAPGNWARKAAFSPAHIVPDRWIKIDNDFEDNRTDA